MPEQLGIHEYAKAGVVLMHDHARDPDRHINSLRHTLSYDLRWLCFIRSTINIQAVLGSHPTASPTRTWRPMWQGERLDRLRQHFNRLIETYREDIVGKTPPRTTMAMRRQHMLDTLFHVARSLCVGLTWDEGFEILERWLEAKGRDPRLYYCTLLGAVERRLERS